MKNIAKTILLAMILGIVSNFTFAQNKYTISVVVKGINERKGKIYASLSNDKNAFPQGGEVASVNVEVTKEGEIVFKFENIIEGKYAIVLFQDLNDNKEMDMNGQMPGEPFGFSNIKMLMGPPNFDQCAFDLNENKALTIGLISF